MPPNQLIEQEIQFKKRARRRLVGAIALVLLMVTVLPMVLDDRAAKPQQQEITITIPSQDGTDFTSRVVPVVPVTPLPESNPENLPIEQAPAEKIDSNNAVENSPLPAPSKDKAVTTAQIQNKAEIAEEKTAGQTLDKSNKSDSFTVQIGVFSDMSSIKKLQQKLQALGYKSRTEKIQTPNGEKIRLRTTPFPNRAEAERALMTIKDSGLSGMVVLNKQDS